MRRIVLLSLIPPKKTVDFVLTEVIGLSVVRNFYTHHFYIFFFLPKGQPSGEAFIQMSSELAAGQASQNRHNRYMGFGKKQRYIEVFQCSGEDMNLVLTGNIAGSPGVSGTGKTKVVVMCGILIIKAKILLKFFYMVGTRKLEVIGTITW